MSSYKDLLEWLYSLQVFGIKLGLETPRALLNAVGNPQQKLKFFHVAGTNGKGSVCAFASSILEEAGYRTGRFTSPHLVDFRERIVCGGKRIPEDDVARILARLRAIASEREQPPTFFEITVVLACVWFAEQNADFVVWETGMGGRLDATNVVLPEVCVLTPVSLDHQQWLGNSLEEIAGEKAGILKEKVPVVCSPQPVEVAAVFSQRARELGCPLHFVESPWTGPCGLAGSIQKWNAAVAAEACRRMIPTLEEERIAKGIRDTAWPGRFQILRERFVLDGAHNPESARVLADTWNEVFGAEQPQLIFGCVSDKPAREILHPLLALRPSPVLFVPVRSPRGTPPSALQEILPEGIPCDSLPAALGRVDPKKKTLVAGSLFLVAEALALLDGQAVPAVTSQ